MSADDDGALAALAAALGAVGSRVYYILSPSWRARRG
jgi:hypothetical protein